MENNLPDTVPPGAGAPELDIEITPEMMAAGASAFLDYDSRFEGEREAVRDIYTAMVRAKVHRSRGT